MQKSKKIAYQLLEFHKATKILDIGCGIGSDVFIFGKYGKKAKEIIGIDISNNMLKEAKRNAEIKKIDKKIIFLKKNIEKSNFDENTFDSIYAERIFQHLEHPKKVMSIIYELLNMHGKVVVVDTNWESLEIKGIPKKDFLLLKKYLLTSSITLLLQKKFLQL